MKVGGEKEKLKEQSVAKKGCSASMVVDGVARKEDGAGSRSSLALVVSGGAEEERGLVIMMEANQLDFVKNLVMSNHRKHSE